MSAAPLPTRALSFKVPACASTSEPCEACSCGKKDKSGSVWAFHLLSTDCSTRDSPCSSECTCDRFKCDKTAEYKTPACPSNAAPCDGCSCGRAPLA